MPRTPSLWWRESHQSWYTTIRGQQHRLGPDKKAAEAEFARLTLGRSGAQPRLRLVELTQLWLNDLHSRARELTWVSARQFGRRWCKQFGATKCSDLRPYHVTAWLDGETTWAPATRSIAIRAIKSCCSWGCDQGYLDRHPLERLKAPKTPRRTAVSEADLARWLEHAACPAVREWVEIALATGARPGEIGSLTAASVNGDVANVTGKRGPRVIVLPRSVMGLVGDLKRRHPTGPLLRSPQGRAWTRFSLSWHFGRISESAGVSIVPYQLRGVFATRSLRANGEVITAKLLGHNGLSMLFSHYQGLDLDDLRNASNRVTPKSG